MRFRLLILVLFSLGTLSRASADYRWGRGWQVAEKLLLGGYFNLTYADLHAQSKRTGLDDLSLFLTWIPSPQLRLFSELELEDLLTLENGRLHSRRRFFSVERLYVDYFPGESWRLRTGKFLTPVGRWNTIHAAPLVWTTSRPLVTEHFFAPHVSGAQLSTTWTLDGRDLDLGIYFDASEILDPKKTPVAFRNGGGFRLEYELSSNGRIGISYLHFKMERPTFQPDTDLFGVDFHWGQHGFEVSAELAHRRPESGSKEEKGLYLQGVAPLGRRLFAVGRYEYLEGTHFLESGPRRSATHLGIAGLAWRPAAPLIFKLEYRFGHQNRNIAADGFLASVAMLF